MKGSSSSSVRRKRSSSRLSSSSSVNNILPPTIPLPISIAIRNLFPPLLVTTSANHDDNLIVDSDILSSLSSKLSSRTVEERCTLVASDVLLRIRLDILLIENNRNNVSKEEEEEILLYSSEKMNCTAHPRWDHLDEQLLLSEDVVDDAAENDEGLYKNLYARFVAIQEEDNNITVENNSSNTNTEILLTEISLDTSNLRRLPTSYDNNGDDDNVVGESDKSNNGKNMLIPEFLPPNAILLHYNDGYTRVMPDLYSLLVAKGIVTENITLDPLRKGGSSTGDMNNEENDNDDNDSDEKNTSVFEEGAFDVLGGTESTTTTTGGLAGDNNVKKSAINLTSASGIDDKVFNLLDADKDDIDNDARRDNNNNKNDLQQGEEDDSTMDTSMLTEETGSHRDTTGDLGTNDDQRLLSSSSSSPVVSLLPPIVDPLPELLPLNEDKIPTTDNIDNEIDTLRQLVYRERKLLEQEQHLINEETDRLKFIVTQVQQLEQETNNIMKMTGVENSDLFRAEFRLEAHRIRLLKQLQLILPIRVMSINIAVNPPQYPQHQYTIASIPLPDDIHAVSVSDDQVSTSIGLLCYLVSLASKYLAITPRYKMICRFSRSAIVDQGGAVSINNKPSTVYPLFRERGAVDKEQLDHGFVLLVKNIECLLQMRQVEYHHGWNALAKMEKLLMHVVDGPSG